MAYLEDEIRKKEELKKKKKEQEELEAQLEEKRILREIEQLNRQNEADIQREREAKARKDQQKNVGAQRQAPPKETKFQEPAGTGGHKTAKDNRRTIDTTDWELAEKKLQENMKRAKENKARSQSRQSQKTPRNNNNNNQIPRTPVPQSVRQSDHLHPPPTTSYSSPAANQSYDQSVKSRSDEVQRRTQFKTAPRQPQKEYRSRGRQSTTLSDISWDNRSEMNLYVDQPAPSRHSRHHYPSSHAVANTKALKEIDRMKEALQQELMHVQYNLDQKDRESKFIYNPVYNSAYPKPQFSAPPRHNLSARNRSILAPPTDEQIRQNTELYIEQGTAGQDLRAKDLVDIKNDDEIGDGAQLDVDTTFMTAIPNEKSIEIQTKQQKEVHFPESTSLESSHAELDTVGLSERNAAREKLIYEVEKSLEAPEDTIDRLQIVSNSTLDD